MVINNNGFFVLLYDQHDQYKKLRTKTVDGVISNVSIMFFEGNNFTLFTNQYI